MDLDLKIELRLNLRRHPAHATIQLDDAGYWLAIERGGSITRIPLHDNMEQSILLALDDTR